MHLSFEVVIDSRFEIGQSWYCICHQSTLIRLGKFRAHLRYQVSNGLPLGLHVIDSIEDLQELIAHLSVLLIDLIFVLMPFWVDNFDAFFYSPNTILDFKLHFFIAPCLNGLLQVDLSCVNACFYTSIFKHAYQRCQIYRCLQVSYELFTRQSLHCYGFCIAL